MGSQKSEGLFFIESLQYPFLIYFCFDSSAWRWAVSQQHGVWSRGPGSMR